MHRIALLMISRASLLCVYYACMLWLDMASAISSNSRSETLHISVALVHCIPAVIITIICLYVCVCACVCCLQMRYNLCPDCSM